MFKKITTIIYKYSNVLIKITNKHRFTHQTSALILEFWWMDYESNCCFSRNLDTILLTIWVFGQTCFGQHSVNQILHCNRMSIHSCPSMPIQNSHGHRLHSCCSKRWTNVILTFMVKLTTFLGMELKGIQLKLKT